MPNSQAFNFLVSSLSMMVRNGMQLNERFIGEYASSVASAFTSPEEIVTIVARPTADMPNKIGAIKTVRDALHTGLAETKFFFDGTQSLKVKASQIAELNAAVQQYGYEIRQG